MEKDKGIFSFRKRLVRNLLDGTQGRKRKEGRLRGRLGILLLVAMLFNTLPVGGLAVYASGREGGLDHGEVYGYSNDYWTDVDTEALPYKANASLAAAGSGQIVVDTERKCVFAQGTPIVIRQNDSITSIYNEKELLSGETDVSDYGIYGGWSTGTSQGDTSIVMESGKVDTIYGGSFAGALTGNSTITVKDGTVSYLYGGGSMSTTQGSTNIAIEGGSITHLYGGGYINSSLTGNVLVDVKGGTITNLYGGGFKSPLTGDASIMVKGGDIERIYGGGYDSTVENASFEVSLALANLSRTVTLDGSNVNGRSVALFSGRKASGQYGAAMLTGIDEVTAEDCKLVLWGNPNNGRILNLERLEIPATGEVVFPDENKTVTIGELAGEGAIIFQYKNNFPPAIQVGAISSTASAPIKLVVEGTDNDSIWTQRPWFQGTGVQAQDSETCFTCGMDGYIPQKTADGNGIQIVKGDNRQQAYLADAYFSQESYCYGDTMTVTMRLVDPSNKGIPDATVEVRSGPNDLKTIASATTGQDGGVTFTLPVNDYLWQSKEYGLQAAFWGNNQYKQNFYGISLSGGSGNMSFDVGKASIVLSGTIPDPVVDAAPAAEFPTSSNAFYTAQIVWSPADPIFRLDRAYTASIRLLPRPGYSLDPEKIESITWNGKKMEFPNPEADGSLLLQNVASFAPIPGRDVVLIPSPAEGGSVTGDGRYPEGAQVTVSAAANAGFHFARWTENGVQVSTSTSYTFTVTSDRTLFVLYLKKTVALSSLRQPNTP